MGLTVDPAGSAVPGASLGPARPEAPTDGATQDAGVQRLIAPTDLLDIQALDGAGALRILLAEVQAELVALGAPAPGPPGPPGQGNVWPALSPSPEVAAQWMIRSLLSVVDTASPDAPAAPETALHDALDRGVGLVAAWHDVPAATLQVAVDVRDRVFRQMAETPPDPAWFEPEWLPLLPSMRDYWRRRRRRQALLDPDLKPWPEAREGDHPQDGEPLDERT